MAKHISKSDLKNPDLVTAELQKGFGWSVRHSKLMMILVLGLVVVGGLAAIWQTFGNRQEMQAQVQYYNTEKNYFDKKQKFDEAKTKSEKAPVAAAAKKDSKNKKDSKSEVAETAPAEGLASGDMDKDYGPEIKGFRDVMSQYSGSKAAKMSALLLSEIYAKYGKNDQALDVLKSSNANNDLLSVLVKDRQASLLADSGKCDEASTIWSSLKNQSAAAFLKDDMQLREGACFMTSKKYAQAQAAFKSLDPKGAAYGKAEKWLRLIPQDPSQQPPTAAK